jgi:hypothetical protein
MFAFRNLRAVLIVIAAGALCVAAAAAEEPSQDEMMQAYMKAATPGPEHAMLAKSAGTWNCTMKSWMDPDGEPMVSEGTEVSRMVLGGRYLESEYDGQAMGMPFEGRGVIGYDNAKKKYVGVWYDNMGTGIMNYEGDYDAGKKELTCKGTYVDALTGQVKTAKMVSRLVSNDHHVFEMWGPGPDGKMVKWMEIVYDRAK